MQQAMHSPSGGKIFATQKSFDGASEASGVFISNETNFDGASEASGVLLAMKIGRAHV